MTKFDEYHGAYGEEIIDQYEEMTGVRLPPHIAKDFIKYIEKKYEEERLV